MDVFNEEVSLVITDGFLFISLLLAISAALVVGIVPVAILIVIFQERVVSGLTAGGIKG